MRRFLRFHIDITDISMIWTNVVQKRIMLLMFSSVLSLFRLQYLFGPFNRERKRKKKKVHIAHLETNSWYLLWDMQIANLLLSVTFNCWINWTYLFFFVNSDRIKTHDRCDDLNHWKYTHLNVIKDGKNEFRSNVQYWLNEQQRCNTEHLWF